MTLCFNQQESGPSQHSSLFTTSLYMHTGNCRAQLSLLRRVFREAGGVDRAADLVEHYCDVGYDHLIPAYAKYNWSWVQYYNVDVHAVILMALVAIGYLVMKLCQCVCWRCCRKAKSEKSKVD